MGGVRSAGGEGGAGVIFFHHGDTEDTEVGGGFRTCGAKGGLEDLFLDRINGIFRRDLEEGFVGE